MHTLSTNLPVHILLTPISPRFPALHRISRVLLLLLLSANALLRRAPRARRSETANTRLRNRLPVSDVLGRLLAPLGLLLCGGFRLHIDGGFGLAQLAAGLLVGGCVCVLALVPGEGNGVSVSLRKGFWVYVLRGYAYWVCSPPISVSIRLEDILLLSCFGGVVWELEFVWIKSREIEVPSKDVGNCGCWEKC